MPGAFFDGTQVWQIVAFVRSLNQTGTSGSVPGDARRGGQLFRQQGCISCHLARGEGGGKGPDLSVIGSPGPARNPREAVPRPGPHGSTKVLGPEDSSDYRTVGPRIRMEHEDDIVP